MLTHGQKYPKDFFTPPVDIKIAIAGTFGELRSNHFHSGIDIKTKQQKNLPIYASQDGYISRIKISTHGFGKALYINHNNGFTTVYAHLEDFNEIIQKKSKKEQYQRESFEIDVGLEKNLIQVKKGEIIGYSGNTGSSTAPHLHFEIRETKTQKILNPMLFGLPILDRTHPIINSILIYHNNDEKELINTKQIKPGQYKLDNLIFAKGPFNIGINTYDLLDAAPNKNGVYAIELYVNDTLFFANEMSEFSFNETKYINSHIDYTYYKQNGVKFQKCFLDINNQLSTNKKHTTKMIGISSKNQHYAIKILVKDSYKNTSILEFNVACNPVNTTIKDRKKMINSNQVFEFKSNTCEIYIPNQSLYRDYPFDYEEKNNSLMEYPIYKVLDDSIPSHKKFIITIKIDSLNIELRKKAFIARIENDKPYYINSKWEENKIIGTSNKFGEFTVLIDTIKPKIEYKESVENNQILFKITDELSGINKYRAEIDSKWILMEYDYKTNLLYHNFTDPPNNKKYNLTLFVTDMMNNKNTVNTTFFR